MTDWSKVDMPHYDPVPMGYHKENGKYVKNDRLKNNFMPESKKIVEKTEKSESKMLTPLLVIAGVGILAYILYKRIKTNRATA